MGEERGEGGGGGGERQGISLVRTFRRGALNL